MTSAEIKPFVGKTCTVKYGKTATLNGTVLGTSKTHLHVKELGEYSIPLEQVKSVEVLT